jgi:uncharacterized protein
MNTTSPRWHRALVTGASSGIGYAIAKQLASEGTELVIVARDRARLEALAAEVNVPCAVLVADLSDRDQLAIVEARLTQAAEPIDLLVNNAGFGFTGRYDQLDIDRETRVIDVNVVAMARLAHAAATTMTTLATTHPHLGSAKAGILNVSSVAGFLPTPSSATYAATKAYVTSFSQALFEELKPLGVVVTALCPGFTRTEFQARAAISDTDLRKIPDRLWQSAEVVARAGLDGLAAGKALVVPGAHNKFAAGLTSALPRTPLRVIAAKLGQ